VISLLFVPAFDSLVHIRPRTIDSGAKGSVFLAFRNIDFFDSLKRSRGVIVRLFVIFKRELPILLLNFEMRVIQ
jgi:hypothetical protein